MSTTTDKLGLKKPAGTDPFLLTDFNSNTDLIDRAPGVYYCTSSTRPSWSSPQAGRMIVETDTKKMFIWPGSGSFVEVVNTTATTANSNATTAVSTANSASSTASAAYTLAYDTAGLLNDLRPLFYSTEDLINVSSSQTSWGPLPDSPAKGLTFTAPASGKITVIISGEIRGRAGSTGLSYIIRTGSGLGSGSIPTTVSGYTPFNPGFLGGLGVNSFGTATNGSEDLILNGSGHVGYHSGLTPGDPYNITFAHYNSNTVGALIKWRSMLITPLP